MQNLLSRFQKTIFDVLDHFQPLEKDLEKSVKICQFFSDEIFVLKIFGFQCKKLDQKGQVAVGMTFWDKIEPL